MGDRILRIRAPHKVHVLSWVLSLEKTGSVPCHFKNCKFMAISVEEMAYHYIYCKCETISLPHECDICHQKTDSPIKLTYHKIHCHSYIATSEELRSLSTFLSSNSKKEITPTLRRAWQIFLENRRYLKCLQRACLYVPESLKEMEDHYLHHCKEVFWKDLKHVCETCHGRFKSEQKLNTHNAIAHNPINQKKRIIKPGESEEVLLRAWAKSIVNHRQAKCPIVQCKFVCNSISALEKHYKFCTGEQKNCVTCPTCNCWLQNNEKLIEHRKCIHKETEPVTCKIEAMDDSYSLNELSTSVNNKLGHETEKEEEARNHGVMLTHVEEYNVSNNTRHTHEDYHVGEIKRFVKSEPPDYDEATIYLKVGTPCFEEMDPLLPLDVQDFKKASSKKSKESNYCENRGANDCEASTEKLLNAGRPVELSHNSRILQIPSLTSATIFQEVCNIKMCSILKSSLLGVRTSYNINTIKPLQIVESSLDPPDLISQKIVDSREVIDPGLYGNTPDILQHKRPWNSNTSDSEQPSLSQATLRRDEMENPRNNSDKNVPKLKDVTDECRAFGDEVATKLRKLNSDEKSSC